MGAQRAGQAGDVPTDLSEMYDAETMRRIDRQGAPGAVVGVSGWRGGLVAGALAARAMSGMADALEVEEANDHVAEVRPEPHDHRFDAVTVHFVPHDAHATVAVVRPWLLAGRG